jgi:hypothetical protein
MKIFRILCFVSMTVFWSSVSLAAGFAPGPSGSQPPTPPPGQAETGQLKATTEEGLKKINPPIIKVVSIAYMPAPLKAGSAVDLSIQFMNVGLGPSTSFTYSLSCKVLSGGPECPVPNTTHTVNKVIQVNQGYSAILMGANPAKAGQYRVSVILPGARGRPPGVTLNVAGTKAKVQPVPLIAPPGTTVPTPVPKPKPIPPQPRRILLR